MESYQIIADIVEKNIEEPYSFLFNIFECYNNDFLKKLTILNTERVEKDLTQFMVKHNMDNNLMKIMPSTYKLKLFVNKFLNSDIKYIKSNNFYNIDVEVLELNNKVIGIKLNSYFYIDKDSVSVNNTIVIDKKVISEWCKTCINNIIKNNVFKNDNLVYFNNIILNYEYYFNKNIRETNLDILPYTNLYNSLILRYDINVKNNKDNDKIVTFLPVSRFTCKNLFIKYQNLFKIFTEDEDMLTKKLITFKNPKNEKFFNDGVNVDFKETDFHLSLRLYCSKINNLDSVYYRKTTEKLDLNISMIVKKGRIIGIKFGKIDYYIWKNEGNLNDYEIYNSKNNYHDVITNVFKDACIFFFKLN